MLDEKISKPVVHPKSFQDEFPTGYLIRLAELNQYQKALWLVGDSQLKKRKNPNFLFEALVDSPWTGYGKQSDFNKYISIDPLYFEWNSMKFCSMCIKTNPYIRTLWQFRASVVCLEHSIWLRDCCSRCGAIISIKDPRISICECGERFDTGQTLDASKDIVKLQEYIEGKRKLGVSDEDDIVQRLDTLSFFSKWARYGRGTSRLLKPDEGFNILVNVAEALFSGRSGFIAFLKKLHGLQERSPKVKHFENFHHQFYQIFSKPHFDHFKVIIEEYINHYWTRPLNGRNRNFSEATIVNHPWIPLRVACRDYDMSKTTLRKALAAGLIRSKVDHKGSRKFTYLYKPDIDDRLCRIKDFITAKEAMLLLGLTKKQFSQLQGSGLFKIAISPNETGLGTWGFSREEIYGICHKLSNGLNNIQGDVWSFSHVLQYYGKKIENATTVISDAILAGELKAVGLDCNRSGFAAMYFTKESVVTWLQLRLNDPENLTIPTAAKILKINQEFTYQLVNRGLLKTQLANDGSRRISLSSISAFQKNYAILAKLASSIEVGSRSLQDYLTSRGIRPIDYKWKTSLRQKIYKKSCLPNIEIFKGIV